MGRAFAPKYDRDHKRGLIEWALADRKRTARQAVELAAKGGIPHPDRPDDEPLPPFEINLGTARALLTQERRRRRGGELMGRREGTAAERLDALTDDGLAILEHEMTQLKLKRSKSKEGMSSQEVGRLKSMVQAARELKSLDQGLATYNQGQRGKRGREHDQAQKGPTRSGDLVSRMVRDTQREQAGEPHTGDPGAGNAPTENGSEERSTEGNEAAKLSEAGTTEGERAEGQARGVYAHAGAGTQDA